MKILHVACMPYPSMQGSQVYLRGLLRAQAKRNDVSLLCYGHGTPCEDQEYQIHRIPKMRGYQRLRAGPDIYKPFLDILIARKLWNLDADIIHVHNYEAPFAAYIRQIKGSIPIVYTAHNLMEEELETYCHHPFAKKISSKFGRWLDAHIPKRADAVIAIRESTAQKLKELGCSSVFTIPPGVEKLESSRHDRDEGSVVYAGNVDGYQNLSHVYMLAQRMPETLFRIITSDEEGIAVGHLPNIEVMVLDDFAMVCTEMQRSSVCIVPRKDCSGFPMKLLNALALGIPVVAFSSAVGDISGVYRCADIEEMESALRLFLQDSRYCEQMGKKGKAHVLSEYSWEKRAIEVEKIYNYLNQ